MRKEQKIDEEQVERMMNSTHFNSELAKNENFFFHKHPELWEGALQEMVGAWLEEREAYFAKYYVDIFAFRSYESLGTNKAQVFRDMLGRAEMAVTLQNNKVTVAQRREILDLATHLQEQSFSLAKEAYEKSKKTD